MSKIPYSITWYNIIKQLIHHHNNNIVSGANDTHEQNLIYIDIPGLPLGAREDDFSDIPQDPVGDDAIVLEVKGKCHICVCTSSI